MSCEAPRSAHEARTRTLLAKIAHTVATWKSHALSYEVEWNGPSRTELVCVHAECAQPVDKHDFDVTIGVPVSANLAVREGNEDKRCRRRDEADEAVPSLQI